MKRRIVTALLLPVVPFATACLTIAVPGIVLFALLLSKNPNGAILAAAIFLALAQNIIIAL